MKTQRLDQLADGIFAIVMTILAFELRVPLLDNPSDVALWYSLIQMSSFFLTFILSFSLLFTYWRAHHFIVSAYAQNLTPGLINYNAVFFFLIILVPFSTKFLAAYSHTLVGIMVYGINVIMIGSVLYFMRRYIEINPSIHNVSLHRDEMVSGYVRILFPVASSFIAIIISLYNPTISLILFTIAIIFNLFPGSTKVIHESIKDVADIVEQK